MTLYEIKGEWLALQEMADSGEYDETVIMDTLESIEAELEVKAEGYAYFTQNINAEIEALKAEEARLQKKRRHLEKVSENTKQRLQEVMEQTGKTKFKSGIFSFSVQKNGGNAPIILDCEVEELPKEFKKCTVEVDKDAIRKFMKNNGAEVVVNEVEGESIPLFHLGERGKSLRIR